MLPTSCSIQAADNVEQAYNRIKAHTNLTPVIKSPILNEKLGHEIYFKLEGLQQTGAFKVRGALNHLLEMKERNILPANIVGYSTGNHALGMGFAAEKLNINARVYLPNNVAVFKKRKTNLYTKLEVIYTESRAEAEACAKIDSLSDFHYLHPSSSDTTIAGAGTACYEALRQIEDIEAIFASCGGGGLLAGSYLAKELLSPQSLIFGVEPRVANDAFLSLQAGIIAGFSSSPPTIADGLRTLAISPLIFNYLRQLDGMLLVAEEDISYWAAWLNYLLNINCEPASAVAMAGAYQWLSKQTVRRKILVILSGGNTSLLPLPVQPSYLDF